MDNAQLTSLQSRNISYSGRNLILAISNFLDAMLRYRHLLPSDAKILFDNNLKEKLQSMSTNLRDLLLLIAPDD